MNRPADLTSKTLANMPKQDLRTWIAQLEAADDVQLVRGANRDTEIGGIVDFYQRQTGNRAVLFDDVPGLSVRLSGARQHPDLDQAHQDDARPARRRHRHGPRRVLAEVHEGEQDHSAGAGADRAGAAKRLSRRRYRPHQNPRAEVARARRRLLHRHRRHGDHAPSRHRLDQLRRLSRAGARQEARLGDVLQGQARQHHPATATRSSARSARSRWCAACTRRCSWWPVSKFPTARTNTTRPAGCSASRSRPFRVRSPACRSRPMPRSRSRATSRSTI